MGKATRSPFMMTILEPYVENILFETAVPIILVTPQDAYLFQEDPIEFVRKSSEIDNTVFSSRQRMIDLVSQLCNIKKNKYDRVPIYLHKFLEFCL